MLLTPRAIAEDASFHAFINGYLREVDGGHWEVSELWCSRHAVPRWLRNTLQGRELLALALPAQGMQLVLDVAYRSQVGRHHFYAAFLRHNHDMAQWQAAEPLYLLINLVREVYLGQTGAAHRGASFTGDAIKCNEVELLSRLLDSYQLMTRYLEARLSDPALASIDFIDSEQALLFGHWLNPTPKSKQGMAFWQQAHYSPELRGEFKLHYFSVAPSLVKEGSVLHQATSAVLLAELNRVEAVTLPKGHVLIPVHPLQAHFLLLQDWVRSLLAEGLMSYLGERGAPYTATSSVRTVFRNDAEWMLKFSIPVRITNSLRNNKRDELEDGMAVERYLRKSGFLDGNPQFGLVDDPGYICVQRPGAEDEASGFEVVLRRNCFAGDKGQGVCSVLALAQAPYDATLASGGTSLLKKIILGLAEDEGRPRRAVALDWFDAYWRCAIESLILLYDRYGIALEAHQQNSLLEVSGGYPSRYYYRDNQGFYLSRQYQDTLYEIDDMLTMSEMFYQDDKIFSAIAYYVFINQLFAVIYRLGADGLVDEPSLLAQCRRHLHGLQGRMTGVGRDFIRFLLTSPQLPSKTNFLARINDIDELHDGMEHAVYAPVDNPLYVAAEADCGYRWQEKEDCHVA